MNLRTSKTTSRSLCRYWRMIRKQHPANFGEGSGFMPILDKLYSTEVQQSHCFLWHFGFYVAHCTHLRKGKYFVCVKYISKESSSTARQQWPIWKDVLGWENLKMRNNISFYYGKPLLEIAATECWQLSADHFIGAFVCLVWRPGLPQHCMLLFFISELHFVSSLFSPGSGEWWGLFSQMCQLKNHPIRVSLRGEGGRKYKSSSDFPSFQVFRFISQLGLQILPYSLIYQNLVPYSDL